MAEQWTAIITSNNSMRIMMNMVTRTAALAWLEGSWNDHIDYGNHSQACCVHIVDVNIARAKHHEMMWWFGMKISNMR